MAITGKINLRCFLDGIEIPVISATVVLSVGKWATATVNVLPCPTVKKLLPRTTIILIDGDEDVVFFGEYLGIGVSKTPSSLFISLICYGTLNHWESTKYVFFSGTQGIPLYQSDRLRAIYGDKSMFISGGIQDSLQVLLNIINGVDTEGVSQEVSDTAAYGSEQDMPQESDNYQHALLGVRRLIKYLANNNTFYSFASKTLRALNTIGIPEEDNSSNALISFASIISIVSQKASSINGEASFLDILNILLSVIGYLPISVIPRGVKQDGWNTPTAEMFTDLILPDLWFAAPPLCNVIFPDEYNNYDYNHLFLNDCTRQMTLIDPSLPGIEDTDELFKTNNVVFSPSNVFNTGIEEEDEALFRSGEAYADASYDMESTIEVPTEIVNSFSKVFSHELYTGPIIRFESIPNILNYVAPQLEGVISSENPDKWLMQRISDMYFYKARWGARSTRNIPCKYLKRVTPGFTGALLMPSKFESGFHLLGYIDTVTHTFTQEGATSYVSFSYPRLYDEELNMFKDKNTNNTPLEEIITPAWFSAIYGSSYEENKEDVAIGRNIYQRYLGCGSILSNRTFNFSNNGVEFSSDISRRNVKEALNSIMKTYNRLKDCNADIASFISQLTKRDFMSLEDLLGDSGFLTGYINTLPINNVESTGFDPRPDRMIAITNYVAELQTMGRGLKL